MAAWSKSRLCIEAADLESREGRPWGTDDGHFACTGCACQCHGKGMPADFRDLVRPALEDAKATLRAREAAAVERGEAS